MTPKKARGPSTLPLGGRVRVMGVDPGTSAMGVGVVDYDGQHYVLVHSSALTVARSASLPRRLLYLYENLEQLVRHWAPDAVAVEEPFVARNSRSAIAIGQAQAVALLAAANHGLPVAHYPPRRVKQSVTGYGASSKAQVQRMVRALLGIQGPLGSVDASDALAVAICHVHASQMERLEAADVGGVA